MRISLQIFTHFYSFPTENPGFLKGYTGFKNLAYLAGIRNVIGKEEIRESMQKVGLDPDSHKKVGRYSLGMKQRFFRIQ